MDHYRITRLIALGGALVLIAPTTLALGDSEPQTSPMLTDPGQHAATARMAHTGIFVQRRPVLPEGTPARQGGDTCATATTISTLPYTDTGTTSGYADNYDPSAALDSCPYNPSAAADVVYQYTPTGEHADRD